MLTTLSFFLGNLMGSVMFTMIGLLGLNAEQFAQFQTTLVVSYMIVVMSFFTVVVEFVLKKKSRKK